MLQTFSGFSIKNLLHNILFFLSGCAVILLNVYEQKTAAVGVVLLLLLILVSSYFQDIHAFLLKNMNAKMIALSCFIAIFSAAVCYNALLVNGSSISGVPLVSYAAACGIASVYFLCVILCLLRFPWKDGSRSKDGTDADKPIAKADRIALAGILVLISGIGLWYLSEKCSLFTDEIYTFGLANSYYLPFLQRLSDGSGIIANPERYINYLTVTSHPFSYGSVLYNQICDVHPPLYYLFIHTVCSIAPDLPLMYVGYLVNAFFAVLTIIGLFVWGYHKFGRVTAYALALSYGLSTSFFSMFMLFRMYMALTLFTVLLTAVVYELYLNGSAKYLRALTFILCLGALTHYYFLVYAFFICLLLAVLLCSEKRWRELKNTVVSAVAAAGIYYSIWGGVLICHLFGTSGTSAVSNLVGGEGIFTRLKAYVRLYIAEISQNSELAFCILGVSAITVLLVFLTCVRKHSYMWIKGYILTFLPGLCSFVIVALSNSSAVVSRYVYNLVPFVWIALWAGLSFVLRNMALQTVTAAITVVAAAYVALFCSAPSYLFSEYKNTIDYLEGLGGGDTVCIYFKNVPWYTESLCVNFLMNYGTSYIVDADTMDWLSEQTFEEDDNILFLAENASHLEEVLEITGCTGYEMIGLYSPIESDTVLVVVYELIR